MSKNKASVLDSLINLVLVGVGLTVLVAIVVVCLPKDGSVARGWQQTWSEWTQKATGRQEWNLAQEKLPEPAALAQRKLVSYNDPAVKRTLDVPWR